MALQVYQQPIHLTTTSISYFLFAQSNGCRDHEPPVEGMCSCGGIVKCEMSAHGKHKQTASAPTQPLGSREEHHICRAAVMRAEAAVPAGGHTREPAHEQPCARRPTAFDCKGCTPENLPCLGLGLVRWNRAKSVVLGPQPLSGQKFFACGALNKEGELAALANSLPHPERAPPSTGAYCRCRPTVTRATLVNKHATCPFT